MYSHSTTIPLSPLSDGQETNPLEDPIQAHAQRFLAELEQAPPDVQAAVYARLLTGLASKITSAVATKAIGAARTEPSSGKLKSTAPKSRAQKTKTAEYPRPDSQLRELSDSTDPVLAWQHFGGSAPALLNILREEPLGTLEAMLRHDRMPLGPKPRGKSREALAEAIVQRLEQQFARPF